MRPEAPRSRRRRRVGVIVVTIASVILVGACTSTRASSGDGADAGAGEAGDVQTVVVIGDSITAGSSSAVDSALSGAGYEPLLIDGEPSRRAIEDSDGGPVSGLSAVQSAIDDGHDPDAWVIALGTNDVMQYGDTNAYARVISELASAVPQDVPLVWVSVYLRDYESQSTAFNGALHTVLDNRPRTVVIDWGGRARDDGVISTDGIHPTRTGHQAFAETIVDGLAALSG